MTRPLTTNAIDKPVWIPATVCSDIVEEACDALLSDKCTSDEDCEVFRNVNRDALLSALQFLNACLVPKTRFKCANKERAFQKFHQAMLVELNVLPLEKLLCPFSATTMAFAVFELLLKRNYDLKKQTQSNNGDEVPEGEVGIVEHIAGFVLFNLKKQAKRINNVAERELVEDCLNALETPEVISTSKTNLPSLTQVLDRGGLTKPTQNICQMFVALEPIFRSTFGDVQSFDFQIYFSKCVASDSVSTCLYEGLYKVNAKKNTKEKLLSGIVKVYFNVRVHHEYKVYMDRHKLSTKTGKQKKSLRKSLQE
ncbi:hypothetical protein V1264_024168 [Littorina saxatilis]|uniref:Uncharacterized protein n=2 Tax=Littorina saxatilis TaxID=31220 RepID=A0AAN9ALD7_9CAEN